MRRALATATTMAVTGALLTVLAPAAHAATTLAVPGRYPTISAAISAAHNGDTVLVQPGTYRENITIAGKNITVRAASSVQSRTVIAGNPGRTPVMIQGVGPQTKLTGFTITGGYAPAGQGGGITIANGASPVIAYNTIQNNHANTGGGILVYNQSNPDIAFNYIRGNSATTFGGGVFAYIGSNPVLHNNQITGNSAYGGGGVYLESNSGNAAQRAGGNVTLNVISGNAASQAGGGIMLRTGEVASITRNTISGNRAPYGGGIEVETNGSGPTIAANTITGNVAATSASQPGSGSGGGIAVFGQSTPLIQGNVVYGNASTIFGGGIVLAEGSNSRVEGNNIAANRVTSSANYTGGGGIFGANSDGAIWNNVFRANSARGGGGLSFNGTGSWVVMYNTIVSNQATGGSGPLGGGLFVGAKTSGKMSVVSNLITANNNFQVFESGKWASYANNLVTNSGLGAFYSYGTGAVAAIDRLNGNAGVRTAYGNLDGNVGMVNFAGGDFRLTANSAAVNHGRAAGAPSNDYQGARRPFGGGWDIGAFEYTG
jgi:hypothetical protein